jgi:hypothetical protein
MKVVQAKIRETLNAKERLALAIRTHGERLLAIFPSATERDPVELCRKLRRLEAKAQAIALRLCNGPEFEGGYDQVDALCEAIIAKVNTLLGPGPCIFVNRDPRGYALKIRTEDARDLRIMKDWGGYGIIAPDLK